MSYIGNPITTQAFVTDQFNGSGSQVTYTMSVAPANTSSVLVSVSGVLQDPSTYSVSGNTLTFSAAPPAGTGNISCRYLGIPATGVTTTAYRTITEFTATVGQTTFTPPSYTVGFINVYRNGIRLGSADYTANSGTVVTLSVACNAGDLVVTESYFVSSVLNAIPATPGSVSLSGSYISGVLPSANLPTGSVLQVVNATFSTQTATTSTSFVSTYLTASITPKFSTSKILILMTTASAISSTSYVGVATIYRNGTTNLGNGNGGLTLSGTAQDNSTVMQVLDSPATTSSTTYTAYVRTNNASGTYYFGDSIGGVYQSSQVTLMEIAG